MCRRMKRVQLAHHHSSLHHPPAPLLGVAPLTRQAIIGVEDTQIIILANPTLVKYLSQYVIIE